MKILLGAFSVKNDQAPIPCTKKPALLIQSEAGFLLGQGLFAEKTVCP
ncbi:hypothetical protein H9L05_04785 [Hymenobacter qilianensis]|uniref:Uncharacterized protein n=1 Tax=Hymenobacter qilianensis TaxID=1385715 RepID=A0A7H0GXJ2_9BACT|nr:hypothetical protein [Hymenobacter qilianensis]QNP53008.1 hypothetical protein H9L05_04785 [Hymenobacter qilianensis]